MSQDPVFVRQAFSSIAPRYRLANHVLSLGVDLSWRREAARLVASFAPRNVLDVATGTGDLALAIQRRLPGVEITGTDFCEEMLAIARRAGLQRTVEADALQLPFATGSFDVVTVAYGLRNMASWRDALKEMGRVLRPGGRLVILDFSLPERWPWNVLYGVYLREVLPRLAGLIAGNRGAYDYLARSIQNFPAGAAMERLLGECGFEAPRTKCLSGGISSVYWASKPLSS
jgi:demethylmenaquinone methyltransferase / 2-methoxy-6-polyprenyl-1,4-benzoquinol methylase